MNPTSYKIDSRLLPLRLRESSFRKHETAIAAIVKAFPKKTPVESATLAPISLAARLRDAMASLYQYQWETTLIDVEKFRREYFQIVVSHKGQNVYAGSRESLKAVEQAAVAETVCAKQSDILTLTTLEEKKLLCWLAAGRMLTQGVAVYGVNHDEVKWLEANFDVSVKENDDGTVTII